MKYLALILLAAVFVGPSLYRLVMERLFHRRVQWRGSRLNLSPGVELIVWGAIFLFLVLAARDAVLLFLR